MSHIERSTEIARPPEEVFDALTDLSGLVHWAPTVAETRNAPDRPLRAGDTFEQTIRVAGVDLETDWTVIDVERPRHVRYECRGRSGGWLNMTQRVVGTNGGSRVELKLDYELPGGVIGDTLNKMYVERRNEREAENALQNLKELLEGQQARRAE